MARGQRRRARTTTIHDERTALERNRDALRALEEQRVQLVAERDELVRVARAGGVSWSALASQAGTTRQALMQRVAEPPTTADPGVPLW